MTLSAEKLAEVRQALLSAAITLLRAGGSPAATTRAVAKASGLTVGAIFSQFGSRGSMLDEAMRQDPQAAEREMDRLRVELLRLESLNRRAIP